MKWDLFCRVIDNHGDLGVCWRLAADLAGRGEQVRLWIDDAAALAWMAPQGAAGVELRDWAEALDDATVPEPGDVVIEAFGCDLPDAFLRRMAARRPAALWIDLEYLSAEDYVERSHRLPSPQAFGPAAGLTRWFFYPGFTAATGGLLREPGLAARRAAFDATAWLAAQGLQRRHGEQVVSLFCYANPALPALLDRLARSPTLLLVTPGLAAAQVAELLGPHASRGHLRAQQLPPRSQLDFDHLLWAGDLNFVRGEDSFVRAQWAGAPFVWHIYPQHDGAHLVKLEAFLARFLAGAEATLAHDCAALWRAWNGARPLPALPEPPSDAPWRAHCTRWRAQLAAQADLVSQLLGFVAEKR